MTTLSIRCYVSSPEHRALAYEALRNVEPADEDREQHRLDKLAAHRSLMDALGPGGSVVIKTTDGPVEYRRSRRTNELHRTRAGEFVDKLGPRLPRVYKIAVGGEAG